jgi:hypothetical protein
MDRRDFIKKSVTASVGVAAGLSIEEKVLMAYAAEPEKNSAVQTAPAAPPKAFPKGKLGDVEVSRVICGGNLISGYAHSRDLTYVSSVVKHYFTEEKIFETFRICEANGINTAMLKLDSDTLRILKKYWHEQGGNIQWIAQIVNPDNLIQDVGQALDNGAVGVFTTGQMGDALVAQGRVDLIAKTVETAKAQGAIAGVSCHELRVVSECEKAGVQPDFYMKTFHHHHYWSAGPKERNDSVFEETPDQTIELMSTLNRPWVAFKVLAAGAISPADGFEYAISNGADFMCVGMFDFQIEDDVAIAKGVIEKNKERKRPWHGVIA